MFRRKHHLALAVTGILLASLSACGGDDDGGDSNNDSAAGEPWILGTTESITAMDPAGSYDFGSWNMQYNIFEQLLAIPAGESDPVARPRSRATTTTRRPSPARWWTGQTFSNGNELTSSDVLFSMKRNIEIADPNGSSVLLGQLSNGDEKKPTLAEGAIETPGRHHGGLPPQRRRHHVPQAAQHGNHLDRRRGDVPGERAARPTTR